MFAVQTLCINALSLSCSLFVALSSISQRAGTRYPNNEHRHALQLMLHSTATECCDSQQLRLLSQKHTQLKGCVDCPAREAPACDA